MYRSHIPACFKSNPQHTKSEYGWRLSIGFGSKLSGTVSSAKTVDGLYVEGSLKFRDFYNRNGGGLDAPLLLQHDLIYSNQFPIYERTQEFLKLLLQLQQQVWICFELYYLESLKIETTVHRFMWQTSSVAHRLRSCRWDRNLKKRSQLKHCSLQTDGAVVILR